MVKLVQHTINKTCIETHLTLFTIMSFDSPLIIKSESNTGYRIKVPGNIFQLYRALFTTVFIKFEALIFCFCVKPILLNTPPFLLSYYKDNNRGKNMLFSVSVKILDHSGKVILFVTSILSCRVVVLVVHLFCLKNNGCNNHVHR